MEDTVFLPGTMRGASLDSAMDLDYMNELLAEGCWLETIDGSEFPHPSPSTSTALFDSSFVWPASEITNGDTSRNPSQQGNQDDMQQSFFLQTSSMNDPQQKGPLSTPSLNQGMVNVDEDDGQLDDNITEGSELSKRRWIGPRANLGPATSVIQRLGWALGYIKDFSINKDVLIQLWVPVIRAGRQVLTTYDQPFSLDLKCQRLANYRAISIKYYFSAEEDSKDVAGLPGRVFLGKAPEWTPDVQFFRSDEYPRVDHAQQYDVRGTLAVPVFEQGSRTCLGVIEVVMMTQKLKYRSELESVCKALEAVDLRSSEVPSTKNMKAWNTSYQAALPEIREVLRCACETHRLPLAQTWVSCIQQGKVGCWHSDKNNNHCVSTVDDACYIADPDMWGFQEACSEHHLLKGQRVAGEAFLTNQPCFSNDITSLKKTEYPLSHHARMFGLCGAVAIRLRSILTGNSDFVLEFFLPKGCRDPEEQKKMLSSLSIVIQQVSRSLRVVTDKEMEEETSLPVSEVIFPSDGRPSREKILKVDSHSEKYSHDNSFQSACLTKVQRDCDVSLNQNGKPRKVSGKRFLEGGHRKEDFSLKGSAEYCDDSNSVEGSFSSVALGKTGEKRRTKVDKTITLQVLQQYFSGSLKDAAKSIGVCPTTLKRICRQHGIKRWPSRKIKKVGHSLQKLQLVIDSVQGASGSFQIGSFYTNFPELASPNLSRSGASPFSNSLPTDQQKLTGMQAKGGTLSPQAQAAKSPSSSCSQSSNSSQCCTSGTQQHRSTNNIAGSEDPVVGESFDDVVLKRVRSYEELHASSQEPRLLPRSQSYKSFREQPIPRLPENGCRMSQEVVDGRRVKVTYGEEKIRLRMQDNWKFQDLLQEIARRFNIDDMSLFDVKYLDDDSDWVLLTCDADLEECIEVCRSSEGQTIKLLLQVSHHLLERRSGSSGNS